MHDNVHDSMLTHCECNDMVKAHTADNIIPVSPVSTNAWQAMYTYFYDSGSKYPSD